MIEPRNVDSRPKSKAELIQELNQFLMVHDINWHLLPESDLERLLEAFRKLKANVDEVFNLLDEILETPLTIVEDSKKQWKGYTT